LNGLQHGGLHSRTRLPRFITCFIERHRAFTARRVWLVPVAWLRTDSHHVRLGVSSVLPVSARSGHALGAKMSLATMVVPPRGDGVGRPGRYLSWAVMSPVRSRCVEIGFPTLLNVNSQLTFLAGAAYHFG
jgi:hypothetical protein